MSDVVPWMPPAKRTALVKESEAWLEVEKSAVLYAVTDDATAAHAARMARQAREILKAKDEERKTITTPLLEAKRATDAYFRPTLETIERIKRHYEQEIARYDRARELERSRVLAASAAQIAASIVPTEVIPEPAHVEKTSVRHGWEPEITDPELVPREFCSPDLAKIRAHIRYADTHKPPREIPGVKFNPKSSVTVR